MHRTIVALALAAALLTASPSGLFAPLWGFFTRVWAENGCVLDPDGHCRTDPGASSLTGDHGCVIDPNGRCIG